MKNVVINFIGGKPLSLDIPDETAANVITALGAGGTGTSTITTDGGRAYIINRAQVTFITVEHA